MTPIELTERIIDVAGLDLPVYEGLQISLMLKDFEQEIRKDQDKITRHACAEASLCEYGQDVNAEYTWEDLDDQRNTIHQAIINTKSI